ncbi:MAG: TetR/AcrR family transcriptional regulator [Thermoleophilia bacterium]|nr:TetR/AcrR family transcriptional regulator [Thermoleophilia bacterium]
MAKVQTPREDWIDAALKALAEGGPEAVRIEALAAGLGVSKGGFYWHFKNRQALLDEALDSWERDGTEDVIALLENDPADAREKLQRLFELAPSAEDMFEVDLALRDWARRDKDIAKLMHRVDDRRMTFLRSQFGEFCADEKDVEARSMLAYSLMIGSYFISAPHGDRSRSDVVQLAVDRLLGESWD